MTPVNLKEYGVTFRCEYPVAPGASTWTRYTVNLMPCEWWLFPEDNPAYVDILAARDGDSTGWLFIIEIHDGETIREYFSTFEAGVERYRESVVSFIESCRYLRYVK